MNLPQVIKSQYHAVLEMLKQTIQDCPPALWDDPADKNRFWRVAFHALFYTHLYLQDTEKDFTVWPKHRGQAEHLGRLPWPPQDEPKIEAPYTKEEVLEYLAFCQAMVEEKVSKLNPDAPSGYDWLPFGKLELQLYNIRHIQQHTGELDERLGARAKVDVRWVGAKPE